MAVQTADQLVKCPHCLRDQEDTCEEHIIRARPSIPQRYDCVWCDEPFTVRQNPATGNFEVEKA